MTPAAAVTDASATPVDEGMLHAGLTLGAADCAAGAPLFVVALRQLLRCCSCVSALSLVITDHVEAPPYCSAAEDHTGQVVGAIRPDHSPLRENPNTMLFPPPKRARNQTVTLAAGRRPESKI